jgi:16S rRNA (cytosine967-C5)-methyltransferase
MTPAARISAAIEVLADIETKRRPAAEALKDWGQMHRFAGSGDRAAIAGLVYDALRRRASASYVLCDGSPRAVMLGMLRLERHLEVDAIAKLFDGSRFAPAPLTDGEREKLGAASLDNAPPHVAGDYPEWLDASLAAVFGEARAEEGAALAARAPLDLRVNPIKADRDRASAELGEYKPGQTSWSPWGLRIHVAPDAKSPAIQSEPAFIKGHVEIQDEGSQLAALLSGAQPGEQVVDLCAGAGGKTLALAAMMENRGQIYATDTDKRRLAPIHARLERAGARNVQVRTPRGSTSSPARALTSSSPVYGEGAGRGQATDDELSDLFGKIDLVLIDAPCTGTGSWRRNPDAKWRLRPGALEIRRRDQAASLERAVPMVKPGGRIAYVTCSVLDEENGAQIRDFLARHPDFSVDKPERVAAALGERGYLFARTALLSDTGLLMTPRRTGTDGFFVSLLRRNG